MLKKGLREHFQKILDLPLQNFIPWKNSFLIKKISTFLEII
jgi:hypothetical protein